MFNRPKPPPTEDLKEAAGGDAGPGRRRLGFASWLTRLFHRPRKPEAAPPPTEDVFNAWLDSMRRWCQEDCSPNDIERALPVYAGLMALQCCSRANEAWEQDPRRQHRNKQLVTLYQPVYRAVHQHGRGSPANSLPALVSYMIETSGGNELERWSKESRERVIELCNRRL